MLAVLIAVGKWVWEGAGGRLSAKNIPLIGAWDWNWSVGTMTDLRAKSRILVIDDEDGAHYDGLRARNYAVVTWNAIRTADAAKLDFEYDLIILDVRGVKDDLDADDGIEALEMLRRDNPWIPVLMFTSFKGTIRGRRREASSRNAQAVMQKSVSFTEFSEAVVDQLRRGASREYFEHLLGSLGCPDPGSLVEQVVSNPRKDVELPLLSGGVFSRDKVARVLQVLRGFVMGTRWKERKQ